jgi:hypothetical protein
MLLQFTCSRTSDLPSILCAAVVVVSFSHVPSSVPLLARFVAISLYAIREPNVEFSWLDDHRVPSVVSRLPVPTADRCHLFSPAGQSPLKLHSLEYRGPSRLAPLRFRCSPSLLKSSSSSQLFGSTKDTPSLCCPAVSVVSISEAPCHVSVPQNATQNKSTARKFVLALFLGVCVVSVLFLTNTAVCPARIECFWSFLD